MAITTITIKSSTIVNPLVLFFISLIVALKSGQPKPCYTIYMKLTRVLFVIAAIIVGVWLLGLLFKLAAWVISSLLYIAALIVIIGLVSMYIDSRKKGAPNKNLPKE